MAMKRWIFALVGCCALPLGAATLTFQPRELFRVPFGKNRDTLAARVDGGNLIIPRGFTMDQVGHFFLYDLNNHRIARFSDHGRFEMEFKYVPTARQVFAHPDGQQNLWMLVSDPERGAFYGVYSPTGKRLREGLFTKYNHFDFHVDDDGRLRVTLSAASAAVPSQAFVLDETTLLMKKLNAARPPESHHEIRKNDRVYSVDPVPGGMSGSVPVARIRDDAHHGVADIVGTVIYTTAGGDIYTRVGPRELRVYAVDGALKGRVQLVGLPASCASIRFDAEGNIYELDGIPDADGQYGESMPGMRLLQWQRSDER